MSGNTRWKTKKKMWMLKLLLQQRIWKLLGWVFIDGVFIVSVRFWLNTHMDENIYKNENTKWEWEIGDRSCVDVCACMRNGKWKWQMEMANLITNGWPFKRLAIEMFTCFVCQMEMANGWPLRGWRVFLSFINVIENPPFQNVFLFGG